MLFARRWQSPITRIVKCILNSKVGSNFSPKFAPHLTPLILYYDKEAHTHPHNYQGRLTMECYHTHLRLWREHRNLQIFTEPCSPHILPSLFLYYFVLFFRLHLRVMHACSPKGKPRARNQCMTRQVKLKIFKSIYACHIIGGCGSYTPINFINSLNQGFA